MTPTATGEERSALPEPIYSTYPPAYFACDLETTGLDPKADRILEIAWTTLDLHFNQSDYLHANAAPLHLLEKEESDA